MAEFFLEWELFQTKFEEKIKTHVFLVTFPEKKYRLWKNAKK